MARARRKREPRADEHGGDLDAITRRHTAFDSYSAIRSAARGGYAPTLPRRGPTEILGLALESDGCRVFWRR